jgi:hypothetical protein
MRVMPRPAFDVPETFDGGAHRAPDVLPDRDIGHHRQCLRPAGGRNTVQLVLTPRDEDHGIPPPCEEFCECRADAAARTGDDDDL